MTKDRSKMMNSTLGTVKGIEYQQKLMNYLLLLDSQDIPCEFRVSTEVGEEVGGKFDDLCYEYNNNNKTHKVFMQLKHTVSKTKKINESELFSNNKKDDFMLAKYIHSYFESIIKSNDVCTLVLFTNISAAPKVVEDYFINKPNDHFILQHVTQSGLFYTFRDDYEIVKKLKDYLIKYYCNIKAEDYMRRISQRKQIEIAQEWSPYQKHEAYLLSKFFEIDNDNRIVRIQRDLNVNDDVLTYLRKKLQDNMSSMGFIDRMKKNFSINIDPSSNLEDTLDCILNKVVIKVPGVSNIACEILDDIFIKRFMESFVLAVEQPKVDEIDTAIKRLLKKQSLCKNLPIESVNEVLYKLIVDKSSLRKQDMPQLLKITQLLIKSRQHMSSSNPHEFVFAEKYLQELQENIYDPSSNIIHYVVDRKILMIKLQQALECIGEFVFVKPKDIQILTEVCKSLKLKNIEGFVFDCIYTNANDVIHSEIRQCINELNEYKVIFATFGDRMDMNYRKICDKFKFIQLLETSRETILNKEINFQGNLCPISKLLDSSGNIEDTFDDKILTELCSGNSITIGEEYDMSQIQGAFYSTFDQQISVDSFIEVLLNDENDFIFGITSCDNPYESEEHLLNICPNHVGTISQHMDKKIFVIHENKNNAFHKQCSFKDFCKHKTKITFWMKIKENCLYLFQVFDPTFYMKRRIECYPRNYFEHKIIDSLTKGRKIKYLISGISDKSQLVKHMGCGYRELRKWLKKNYLIIAEGEQEAALLFSEICRSAESDLEVHWFMLRDNRLVKRVSKKNSIFDELIYDEEKLCNLKKGRLIILSDGPGSGKTTTLNYICCHLSKTKWIIRIDFRDTDVRDDLRELSGHEVDKNNIITFIQNRNYLNWKNHTTRHLLKTFLWNCTDEDNRLVFVLDGFDEVPSDNQKEVINILDYLIKHTTCRIYLTTRTHYELLLEKQYNIHCCKLEHLTYEDQKIFLQKYWLYHGIFSKAGFSFNINMFLINWNKIFTINPLHVKLLSELLLDGIIKKSVDVLSTDVSLHTLIPFFVEKKFERYITEKKHHIHPESPEAKILLDAYHEIHTNIAMKHIFPEHYISLDCTIPEKYYNDIMLIGVLYSTSSHGQIYFEHRTIAEYLCVKHLAKCLHECNNSEAYKKEKYIASKIVTEPSFTVLQEFLYSIVANDSPLNKTIIKKDFYSFCELIDKDEITSKSMSRDVLGYTALHYAILYQLDDFFIALMPRCAPAFCFRDISGRTLLHYHKGITMFCDYFLDKHPLLGEGNAVPIELQGISNIINTKDMYGKTPLHYADINHAAILLSYGADCRQLSDGEAHRLLISGSNLPHDRFCNFAAFTVIKLSLCFPKLPIEVIHSDVEQTLILYSSQCCRYFIFLSKGDKNKVIDSHFIFINSGVLVIHEVEDNPRPFGNEGEVGGFNEGVDCILEIFSDLNFKHPISERDMLLVMKHLHSRGLYFWYSNELKGLLCKLSEIGFLEIFKFIQENVPIDNHIMIKCLRIAIQNNHINIINYIWMQYEQCIIQDSSNKLLHLAAKYGNLCLVKHLFYTCSAQVNLQNNEGQTALHLAGEEPSYEVIKYLIRHGGNANIKDNNNDTVLDNVIKIHIGDYGIKYQNPKELIRVTQCIEYLLFDVGVQLNSSFTFDKDILNKDQLSSGCNIGELINESKLLHSAVKHKDLYVVRMLLALGADPNVKDHNNKSAMEYSEEFAMSLLLFRFGAYLNISLKGELPENIKIILSNMYSFLESNYREKKIINDISNVLNIFNYILNNEVETDSASDKNNINCFSKIFMSDIYPDPGTKCDISCYGFSALQGQNKNLVIYFIELSDYKYESVFQDQSIGDPNNPTVNRSSNYDYKVPHDNFGNNLSWQDDVGNSPLHIAASLCDEDAIHFLLHNGVTYNSVEKLGKTPEECVIQKKDWITKVFHAINKLFSSVKENKIAEIKNNLLHVKNLPTSIHGGLVNVRDKDGRTVLHYSVINDNVDIVKLLLTNTVNVNICDKFRRTPLHYTSNNKSVDCMIQLLKSGAIFNSKDKDGKTPLDLCAGNKIGLYLKQLNQTFETLKKSNTELMLKDLEADIRFTSCIANTIDREGNTLYALTKYQECKDIMHFILRNGGCCENIDWLNDKNSFGNNYKYNICKYYEYLDDVTKKTLSNLRFSSGETFLYKFKENYQIVNLLLKNITKENINVRNKRESSVLMTYFETFYSGYNNYKYAIFFLCERGANVNVQNIFGDTPLHNAVKSNNLLFVRYLLHKGADYKTQNYEHKTPVDLAKGDILKYIEKFIERIEKQKEE